MEAATEVARQLRMRDIGGLVVVDFIDMRSAKHRRNVEKAMRDAMKDDKAKHTTSRLSDNGLLEINRQRLKKALQLRTHRPCPTCSGAGTIASPELVGLNTLRRIETRAVSGRLKSVRVSLHPELADAIQNELRRELADLEREFDIRVEIIAATGLHRSEEKIEWIERTEADRAERAAQAAVTAADLADGIQASSRRSAKPAAAETDADESSPTKPARKRRRGGRNRRKTDASSTVTTEAEDQPEHEEPASSTAKPEDDENATGTDKPKKKRRRGGRKRRKKPAQNDGADNGPSDADSGKDHRSADPEPGQQPAKEDGADKPKKSRRRRPRRAKKSKAESSSSPEPAPDGDDPFAY